MLKGSNSTFKSWSQINISWNDPSIEQTEHAIFDIVLRDRWRISEWVISEIFGKNPLSREHFVGSPCANSQFLKLDITDPSLGPPVLKLIWNWKQILISQELMASYVFWITSQIVELLFIHLHSYWLANYLQLLGYRRLLFFHQHCILSLEDGERPPSL